MAQENGSRFKLVFTDWWYSRKYLGVTRFKFPFPNGLHPAFIAEANKILSDDKITNPILLEKSFMRSTTLSETFQKKDPDTGIDNGNYYRHTNFIGYFAKAINPNPYRDLPANEYCVTVDEIDPDDDKVYYYPLEIEWDGVRLAGDTNTICVQGEVHTYRLVDLWPKKLIEYFKSGKVKIVLSNIVDPCAPMMYIHQFEDNVKKLGIPQEHVIWIQGNIPNEYFYPNRKYKSIMLNSIISLTQANENIKKYPRETGYTATHRIMSDIVRPEDLDSNKLRKKKFLCFNRSMGRPHRMALAYLALKHELLDDGIWSFLNHTHKGHCVDELLKLYPTEFKATYYADKIWNMLPYEIDTQHLSVDEKFSFQNIDVNIKEIYNSTYLHIVSETLFWDEFDAFFSEKTWRPMLNLQPFIYVGNYKALDRLQKLGFKTFHPYIDESYDNERDPVVRMHMIEKELLKFKAKSLIDIHNWYYSITDILKHNQELIRQYNNYDPLTEIWKL